MFFSSKRAGSATQGNKGAGCYKCRCNFGVAMHMAGCVRTVAISGRNLLVSEGNHRVDP
jgi:hypothetical protein